MNSRNEKKRNFNYQISLPNQDPFLLIQFINRNIALLFDCGVRVWGRIKTILKLEYLFITHAHIDHLIGFDHIIRALLGESKDLKVFGPPGIRERLQSKLNGYDWDRASDQELSIFIHEISNDRCIVQTHKCRDRFKISHVTEKFIQNGILVDDQNFCVKGTQLDHGGSPCMAYSFEEKDQLRINKDNLLKLNLNPGPWVGEFLQILNDSDHHGDCNETINVKGHRYSVEDLKQKIVMVEKVKKLTYITDTVYSNDVIDKVKLLANNSDIIFCEATFLDEDSNLAQKYHHLTTKQAANFAKTASAKKLMLFHISSRYFPQIFRAVEEARTIFPNTDIASRHRRVKK